MDSPTDIGALIESMAGMAGNNGQGILELMTNLVAQAEGYKGKPVVGTGIGRIVEFTKKAGLLNDATVGMLTPELPGIFGGYPTNTRSEIGPDALFISLFAIMFIANMGMFIFNTTRKHRFYLLLGLATFCLLKVIGFSTRLAWAHNPASISIGICSVVFIQVAQLVLQGLNLVLAHRIFTWHHPQTGYHWTIVWPMNALYFFVIAIMVIAIVGQTLPFLYFMNSHHYNICLNIEKAAAVLNLSYSTLPFSFLLITFALKPGSVVSLPKVFNGVTHEKESIMPSVYQATWVKSAHLFYYPEYDAQWNTYRGDALEDAIRIIPSREPPKIKHKRVNAHETMHPLAPHLHWTVVTVVISSLILTIDTCFRLAACFNNQVYAIANADGKGFHVKYWPHEPYVMFIFYGATEICVLAFYLLMRIDLRFYIPDKVKNPPVYSTGSLEQFEPFEHMDEMAHGSSIKKGDNTSFTEHAIRVDSSDTSTKSDLYM